MSPSEIQELEKLLEDILDGEIVGDPEYVLNITHQTPAQA